MQQRTRPPQLVERWSSLPNVGGVLHLPRVLCQLAGLNHVETFQVCSAFICARDLLIGTPEGSLHHTMKARLHLLDSIVPVSELQETYSMRGGGGGGACRRDSFFRWSTS